MGRVDPKTAEAIEKDMAELDSDTRKANVAQSSKVVGTDCECVETGWKPGLLDEHTLCPKCHGTGKLAQLSEG